MPNYAGPAGQIGSALGGLGGGVGGAGIGGLLGSIGGVLDMPRQSIYNLGRGIARGVSGEGSWDDALGALPGALGTALAGGLIASGVGAPLGIAAGSLLGGVSQGIGKSTGREAFDAPEVSDLTGTDEMIPNMLIGALTDPLTYAGGFGGAAKGAAIGEKAGQGVGGWLERGALAKGPNYAGGAEKIKGAMEQALDRGIPIENTLPLQRHLEMLGMNPAAMSELEPGSTLRNFGQSTATFDRPSGGVTQFTSDFGQPAGARINIPDMVQAERAKVYEAMAPTGQKLYTRVEHAPTMDTFPHQNIPSGVDPEVWQKAVTDTYGQADALGTKLRNEGVFFGDRHPGNVGWDASGRMKIIDADSVHPNTVAAFPGDPRQVGQALPLAQDVGNQQPGMIQNMLLKLLGSDKTVQQELAQKLAAQSVTGESPLLAALRQQTAELAARRGAGNPGLGLMETRGSLSPTPLVPRAPSGADILTAIINAGR